MPGYVLQYSQLMMKAPDPAQTTSAHEVHAVEWTFDSQAEPIKGFFKPLNESNYPALLAKYSVAISVFMRMWLGEIAAEELLVLDETGKIVGSVSKKHPDYLPLLCFGEALPLDPEESELVSPTTVATLLSHNTARLLVAAWAIGDPDLHPKNMSIKGQGCHFDNDECLPRQTGIIKGAGLLEGLLLQKPQKLRGHDLNNFPNLEGSSYRKHWPTNYVPGNGNVFKQCQAYQVFRELAANPEVEISGHTVSFQEQMFESLLTMLLSYDPQMLRARLNAYLGAIPLDYLTLKPEQKVFDLQDSSPELFNETSDKASFVEHMLRVFQQQYDELYRAVVFYEGCVSNQWQVPVVSFLDFLHARSSARNKIITWAREQNQLHVYSESEAYSIERMTCRYQQIWRDAHLTQFDNILCELENLVNEIREDSLSFVNLGEPLLDLQGAEFAGSIVKDDFNFTEAWQLIERRVEGRGADELMVGKDENPGLRALISFRKELIDLSEDYFKCACYDLSLEANRNYCAGLLNLVNEHSENIFQGLKTTLWVSSFDKWEAMILVYYGRLQLPLHLVSRNRDLRAQISCDFTSLLKSSHTEPKIVTTFIKSLFSWANKVPKERLIAIIQQVMEIDYDKPLMAINLSLFAAKAQASAYKIPNPLTTYRKRGEGITIYLEAVKTKQEVDGANILAYILSTGKCEKTSLNTCIIKRLLPLVLNGTLGAGGIDDVNLMSLDYALSTSAVDYVLYTKAVMDYVRTAPLFRQVYSHYSQEHFNRALYRFVDGLPREPLEDLDPFKRLVREALVKYDPASAPQTSYLSLTWALNCLRSTRTTKVCEYLKDQTLKNSQILGLIFKEGGVVEASRANSRSLNVWLADIVFDAMKDACLADRKLQLDVDYQEVLKIKKEEALHYLSFPSFPHFAKRVSDDATVVEQTFSDDFQFEDGDMEALSLTG